jgi:hypothetical protein
MNEMTERRMAKVPLRMDDLAELLQIPDNLTPVQLVAEWDPPTVWVVVAGPNLEPAVPGAELPVLGGWWAQERFVDAEGTVWGRITWEDDAG